MPRPKIVAGNWKMNLDLTAAQALTSEIVQMLTDETASVAGVQVIVCPPAPLLLPVGRLLESRLALGGQTCHHKPNGAYTGEVAAGLLQSVGCEYVLLGHSERRLYNTKPTTCSLKN